MKRAKKSLFICIFLVCGLLLFFSGNAYTAKADTLSDAVKDQVDNIDLDDIEGFFEGKTEADYGFFNTFNDILQGKYSGNGDIVKYFLNIVFSDVLQMLPLFGGIVAITLLYALIWNSKSAYLSDGVGKTVKTVVTLSVILILSSEIIYVWQIAKNLIENAGKFSAIMSPIILTLMMASGGTASAAIYKPSVLFFTDVVIQAFNYAVLPLIATMGLLGICSNLSAEIKIKGFTDFFSSLIKWIFGIVITLYGIFITVQGISASVFDGVSVKIAKYAVSNSIPMVGGLIKDGFDVITAGSVIIKNALGISGVLGMLYIFLSPVAYMAVFSLLLKLTAAVTETYSPDFVSGFLSSVSKTVSYLIASVFVVGLMAFITALLMIFSANTVI